MKTLLRILTLIRKELQILLADPQSRNLIIVPVLLQTILFPLAATLEVKNNTLAIFNEDGGSHSIELAQRLAQAKAFTHILTVHSTLGMRQIMDSQQAIATVHFAADFSSSIFQSKPASLQIILDGRRSNSSQIAALYIQKILNQYLTERGTMLGKPPTSTLTIRNRYNPNLEYSWFVLPSLIAVILTVSALILTALSVAREREHGTFEQLLVSPLTPEMIMIGKAAAVLLVGLLQATIIFLAAVFIYRVPFSGSVFLLYASAILYFLALVGVGLLISALCKTQQQAFLGAFAFIMPAIMLSGFASPVENMPAWLQTVTLANPIRHFIGIAKAIFLKGASLEFVVYHGLPLLLIAFITLSAAVLLFRSRFS